MLVTIQLSKHYGANIKGEVASFSPQVAEHILKHNGGVKLCEFDEAKQAFDPETKRPRDLAKR